MFNADLALSVTMTAISTILSVFMLPANLILYANISYGTDVTHQLDWRSVFIALLIVIIAIGLGLFCSYHSTSLRFNIIANKVRFECLSPLGTLPTTVGVTYSITLDLGWKRCRTSVDRVFGNRHQLGRRELSHLGKGLDLLCRLRLAVPVSLVDFINHCVSVEFESTRSNVSIRRKDGGFGRKRNLSHPCCMLCLCVSFD